jgi:hypothetical protein
LPWSISTLRPKLTARWAQDSASAFLRPLTGRYSKAWLVIGWVSTPARPDERAVCPDILFLDYYLPGLLRPSLDIDHASHVSFYASVAHATTLFPKCVLMEISSFAIWEGNKIIMAITVAIWVGNIGLQLSGEFTFSILVSCES